MDAFLQQNRSLPPKELAKRCFLWMFAQLERYPMLKQVSSDTAEYLYRKLPQQVIDAHTQDDGRELARLGEYGVHFKCGIGIATKILQTLAISFLNLQNEGAASQAAIMELMLDGVLSQIVEEEA